MRKFYDLDYLLVDFAKCEPDITFHQSVSQAVKGAKNYIVMKDGDKKTVFYWDSCFYSRQELTPYSKFDSVLEKYPGEEKFLMTVYDGEVRLLPFSKAKFVEIRLKKLFKILNQQAEKEIKILPEIPPPTARNLKRRGDPLILD